jgi:uncharacterized protein (DUF305 family)
VRETAAIRERERDSGDIMKLKLLVLFLILSAIAGAACAPGNSVANSNSTTQTEHSNMSHGEMNHNGTGPQHASPGTMDHSAMTSSPNASSAPYDLQYIDTMLAHHQGAIEMAKMAETKAQHPELKALAKTIVAAQERENGEMKAWREKWFAGQAPAINMEMSGMHDSMKDMDMQELATLGGREFDLEFIRQMIPHHEGAVAMAREALQKSQRAEIKSAADSVIRDQEAEIKQMKGWQAAWQK